MREYLHDAYEELKRVEHLISVSLKYTRTVDVFKSIIDRMINAYDVLLLGFLDKAKTDGKLQSVPAAPRMRCEGVMKLYGDNAQMQEYLQFYLFLRSINRAEFDRRNEFRRHVTMIAYLENDEIIEIKMDTIAEYRETVEGFVNYVKEMFEGKKE